MVGGGWLVVVVVVVVVVAVAVAVVVVEVVVVVGKRHERLETIEGFMTDAALPARVHIRARLQDLVLEEAALDQASNRQIQYLARLCDAYWRDSSIDQILSDARDILPVREYLRLEGFLSKEYPDARP